MQLGQLSPGNSAFPGFGKGDSRYGEGDLRFGEGDSGFGEGDSGFGKGDSGFGGGDSRFCKGAGFGGESLAAGFRRLDQFALTSSEVSVPSSVSRP